MKEQANSSKMERPCLQPTVVWVPISNDRIAFHRGVFQASENVVVPDPDGWCTEAIRNMDGTNTTDEILIKLRQGGYPGDITSLTQLIHQLSGSGLVLDAEALGSGELTEDQCNRYSRNLNGWAALSQGPLTASQLQLSLANGHVLIMGAGGLGSTTARALAMAGCGKITIVDFDNVELSNLNRQLFDMSDIGKIKVDAAKQHLDAINPDVEINVQQMRLTSADHVRKVVGEILPDFVVAAIDRPVITADRWINDACFSLDIPFICNSVSAGTGMVWSKVPDLTGCFHCDELWAKERSADHYEVRRHREELDIIPGTSAFSFGAMAIGAFIASEAVRSLVDWPMASAGKLVVLDFASLTTTVLEKPPHPACECRVSRKTSMAV